MVDPSKLKLVKESLKKLVLHYTEKLGTAPPRLTPSTSNVENIHQTLMILQHFLLFSDVFEVQSLFLVFMVGFCAFERCIVGRRNMEMHCRL